MSRPRPAQRPGKRPAIRTATKASGRSPPAARVQVRVMLGRGQGLGPGKASLLEAIRETRSITAAGRRFGMSYRRAWLLVEELNALCAGPLVVARRGGAGGGGAEVTALGEQVLKAYRDLQTQASRSGPFRLLSTLLRG